MPNTPFNDHNANDPEYDPSDHTLNIGGGIPPAFHTTIDAALRYQPINDDPDDPNDPDNADDLAEYIDTRSATLDEIVGQEQIKLSLRQFIGAALARKRLLPHTMFFGPPGLGKTEFSKVIASEMSGDLLEYTGSTFDTNQLDLFVGRQLSNPGRTFLFIDEIHKLEPNVMTILLPILEEFNWNGTRMRPFTLIGATTDPDRLLAPFLRRFGLKYHLEFYTIEELEQITQKLLTKLLPADQQYALTDYPYTIDSARAIQMIAQRSVGVPGRAKVLVEAVIDFHYDLTTSTWMPLNPHRTIMCMRALEVDRYGLVAKERAYIHALAKRFKLAPTGINSIAAALGDDPKTIEKMIEPILVRQGFVNREARGRKLTTGLGVNYAMRIGKYHAGLEELPWE